MRGTFKLAGAAVLFAAAVLTASAPTASADGQCTSRTNAQAHQACVANLGGQCGGIGMFGASHSTCNYPDGSRDECDWHLTSLTTTDGTCTWFPSPPDFPIGPQPGNPPA